MEKDFMLTTFDNPFNPFTNFDSWFKQDLLLGHDCCGTLARETNASNLSSETLNEQEELDAIKRIVANEPMIYRMVSPLDYSA